MSDILILRSRSGHAQYAPLLDVVFVHRDKNNNPDVWFSLRAIKSSSALELVESAFPDHMGRSEGSGVHRLTGSITVALNSVVVANQIMRLQGQLFEAHFLFKNLTGMSIPWKEADGTGAAYSGFFEYLSTRYPLVEDWRDEFGVKLTLRQGFGGSNREFTFNVTGITYEAISLGFDTEADFYARLPELPGLTQD